jgi:hypothetical protein
MAPHAQSLRVCRCGGISAVGSATMGALGALRALCALLQYDHQRPALDRVAVGQERIEFTKHQGRTSPPQ